MEAANQVQVVERDARSALERAKTVTITSGEQYRLAGELLLDIKRLIKEVESTFGPIKQKAHAAWQETIAQEKKARAPLDEAVGIISPAIIAYDQEQERIRLEQQRELERQQKQAEEDARIEEAAALEEQGETEAAEQVLTAPSVAAPVVVPSSTPKVNGLSTRKSWDFKIIDPAKIGRAYMKADEVKIRAQVKALGPEAAKLVGGIQVFETAVIAGRVR